MIIKNKKVKKINFLKTYLKARKGLKKNGFFLAKKLGINLRINVEQIKQKNRRIFNKTFRNKLINKKLNEKIKKNILFLIKNKSFKGNRHKFHYPVRGQRTHTNAKKKKHFLKNYAKKKPEFKKKKINKKTSN
jgi:ribosomal protein S13